MIQSRAPGCREGGGGEGSVGQGRGNRLGGERGREEREGAAMGSKEGVDGRGLNPGRAREGLNGSSGAV